MRWMLFLLLIGSCTTLLAQKERSQWLFGQYAGIQFGGGCFLRSEFNSAMNSREGCSSWSDANGNLLVYSNGETVWNRFHKPISNGLGLRGHISSSQSCLFVPWPGHPDHVFLFTTDASENKGQNGLLYSLIDLKANNQQAQLTQREISLNVPTTERLCAVAPCHKNWYWVISREFGTNLFLCYKIDSEGIHAEPVVSSAGFDPGDSPTSVLGCLQASSDGRQLALAHQNLNRVEVFDFDPETGSVSHARLINNVRTPYGVCFSPDGRLLYVSARYGLNSEGAKVYQFKLNSLRTISGEAPQSHVFYIQDTSFASLGTIQVGIDEKLYFARFNNTHLGIIEHPNRFGASAGFNPQGYYLNSRRSTYSLPNFPVAANEQCNRIEVCDSMFCTGDTIHLSACQGYGYSWQWHKDGKPIDGANQFSFFVSENGRYTVEVKAGSCQWIAGPVDLTELKLESTLQGDSVLCPGESLNLRTSGKEHPGSSFQWQRNGNNIPDEGESSYSPKFPGRYSVKITNRYCSYQTDTVRIRAYQEFANIMGDSILCTKKGVMLFTEAHPEVKYQWFRDTISLSKETISQFLAYQPGIYRVLATYRSCSTSSPPFKLQLFKQLAQLSGDTHMCPKGDTALLKASCKYPVDEAGWLINGISLGRTQDLIWPAHRAGNWQVILFKDGCADTSAVLQVHFLPVPKVSMITSPTLESSLAYPVHFEITFASHSELATRFEWMINDGGEKLFQSGRNAQYAFNRLGLHSVQLTAYSDSGCQAILQMEVPIIRSELSHFVDLPNAFTPNQDGNNERYTFPTTPYQSYRLVIFDRWNNILYQANSPQLPDWDGFNNGQRVPEGSYVYRFDAETFEGERIQRTGVLQVIH